MNCIHCDRQVNFMWRNDSGFICGSCLIPAVQSDTDLNGLMMVREAYKDQFSTGLSSGFGCETNKVVIEAMKQCINQAK